MTDIADARARRLAALPFERVGGARLGWLGAVGAIREIVEHRQLLRLLVRRELKARYKDSSLGFVWSLIRPLTMLLIYFVAIGQFLGAARSIPEFGIFVYAGLTIWGLYNEIVVGGTSSIISNAGLIKKVYLPREIFPLAAAGSAMFNFVIQSGVLLGAVLVLGQFPLSWDLLYVPAGMAVALVYGVALAILLSALNVFLRDIQYLVDVAMLILFWASPIVYSWSFVVRAGIDSGLAWLSTVYLLNPISLAVIAFQRGAWRAGSTDQTAADGTVIPAQPWPENMDLRLLIAFIVGLVLLVVAQRIFDRLQGNFAQEI